MGNGLFRRHGLHLLRNEGIGCGFDPHFIPIKEAWIIVEEADQPDLVIDLANADDLAGEDLTQVDLSPSEADAPTAGHAHGFIVIGVLGLRRRLIGAC